MDHGRGDGGKGVIVTEFDFLVQLLGLCPDGTTNRYLR